MVFTVAVIRPDDLLNLQIEFRNLALDTSIPGHPVLVPEDAAQVAYLIVQFPPQTIAEEALYASQPGGAQPPPDERSKPANQPPGATAGSQMPGRARSRMAQPSRLVFKIPANSNPSIPYTTEGLLDWSNLELSVSPIAAIADPPTPAELANVPAIAPPGETETALEMPYRLVLSPNGTVRWTHALSPQTHAGRTELWHTRLTQQDGEQLTELSKTSPAPLRAIWSPDYTSNYSTTGTWPVLGQLDSWGGQPTLTAMNRRDRHELVILTSAFRGFVRGMRDFTTYQPKPVYAEQVMLSSLGGWLKSRGNWNPPVEWIPRILIPIDPPPIGRPPIGRIPVDRIPDRPFPINPLQAAELSQMEVEPAAPDAEPALDLMALLNPALRQVQVEGRGDVTVAPTNDRLIRLGDPGQALNLSEWVHVATQGRDHYVRIVYEGYLYPFGHRAALVKVTERKFNQVNGTPVAYLEQRMFIVVRQPQKDYTQANDTQEALPQGGRRMPLKRVRLTTLMTPDIDFPDPAPFRSTPPRPGDPQYSFWIRVGGRDFQFHAIGQDSENHPVDFTAALVFVPNSDASVADAVTSIQRVYRASGDRRACPVPGQSITYADRSDGSDNTTLTTRSLYFDTDSAAIAKFIPKLAKASVNLTAVEQLTGTSTPTEIQYYENYVTGGFDGGNEVFAELVNKVQSTFSADKGGGIATPNLSITGVTRKLGAVAGNLTKAAANTFDPGDFFADVADTATLFGKIKLIDLLVTGTYANAPNVQFFPQASPPNVKLNWKPDIKDVDVGFFSFIREAGSELEIQGVIEQPIDGSKGRSLFTGTLTRFYLRFLKVVKLSFDAFSFRAETGKKIEVNVQLKGDDPLQFEGDLEFVNELKNIIPPALFGDGPSLELTPQPAIRAGFAIGLPPVEVGVFALKDVSLGAALTLPFLDGSPLFDFNISEREHPFNLTIAFFGGGGFFRLQLDTKAVRVVEAAFEFGASASINLGVASGGVHIMAGIYFKLERRTVEGKDYNAATLSGYFRMGGELSVLGLISISLEFNLSFTYKDPGKAYGRATLTVKVEVLFFSKSIEISVEKEFGSSSGDPTFAQVWEEPAWNEYAMAFA
jgi:hypothetical protein